MKKTAHPGALRANRHIALRRRIRSIIANAERQQAEARAAMLEQKARHAMVKAAMKNVSSLLGCLR